MTDIFYPLHLSVGVRDCQMTMAGIRAPVGVKVTVTIDALFGIVRSATGIVPQGCGG